MPGNVSIFFPSIFRQYKVSVARSAEVNGIEGIGSRVDEFNHVFFIFIGAFVQVVSHFLLKKNILK
jgi:hypothetical protein